jgi:dihydrofolate synthase/folylpolyglutamate synthase
VTEDKIVDFDTLFAKRATHIKPGLQRIERSYEFLKRPAARIPAALIGGTNGKGSTSGFLWYLFALNQRNIGLYSSPHLAAFSERCQLSLTPCDDNELAEVWRQLQQELPPDHYDELSFFEIATLLAFQLFQQKAADFQVLEVGLGGRWDATNVSDPLVSALVSVSKDHQEYLGSDLIGIMNEKLGIMRPGRPLFWGNGGEVCEVPGYREHLLQQTAKNNVPLYEAGRDFGYDAASETIVVNLPDLPLCSLPIQKLLKKTPLFLRRNLALAAAMYHYLQQTLGNEKWKPLNEIWPLLCEGQAPAPVTLYGRSQRLKVLSARGPVRLILDVSHNPDGAQAFLTGLASRGLETPMPALVCILKDKEMNRILDVLRSRLHPVILFGIEHERAWQPELLDVRHRDLPFYTSFQEAFQEALVRWNPADAPWAICGSVLAVGQILQHFDSAPKNGISLERCLSGDW